jgi:excisionase family DNA binding protein
MNEQLILTIDETAALLRVSKRSIYEYVSARGRDRMKANPFPCLRIGDRVLFVKEDVLAWVTRQKEAA